MCTGVGDGRNCLASEEQAPKEGVLEKGMGGREVGNAVALEGWKED